MNLINFKYFLSIPLIALLVSCGSDNRDKTAHDLNDVSENDSVIVSVSNEVFDKMINSIPSPIELGTIIKESGAAYNPSLLNKTNNVDTYMDEKYKAINLGIFTLDLGYMNLYNKSLSTIDYLNAIHNLSSDLNLSSFFDVNTLRKLSSSNNSEELMTESMASFRSMNNFLIKQKRGEVSVLVLFGSWIEGIYLTSECSKIANDANLRERLAEQKVAADNMMILLTVFENNPNFSDLIADVKSLQQLYEGVTITHIYEAPTQKMVDGELEIIDNSRNEIKFEKETINKISEKISEIRNKITKNTK